MNVMSAVINKNQVDEAQQNGQSPISILHEIFPGAALRPSFTFSVHQDSSSPQTSQTLPHSLLWQCTVEVPNHGYGSGTSYSKKNAKSKACLDILAQLGHDVAKFNNLDHLFNNNLPQVVKEQIVTMLPLPSFEETNDGQCKLLERCFNSCCVLNVKCDPDGELEPRFFRLYLAAMSQQIRDKHGATRERNPCGYLEMLCKKVNCEPPTFTCEFKDFTFVTSVTLGPWTASGSAPSKKHSKFIASSSLVTSIEEYCKQH